MKDSLQECLPGQTLLFRNVSACMAFRVGPFCDIKIPTFAGYVSMDLPLRCGDGRVMVPEECNDGNTQSGDGCDAFCKIEPFTKYLYTFNPEFEYDPDLGTYGTFTVSPPDSTWYSFVCGDGLRNLPSEECDDGNENELDGCSKDCKESVGYICARNITVKRIPGSNRIDDITNSEVCGGGVLKREEGGSLSPSPLFKTPLVFLCGHLTSSFPPCFSLSDHFLVFVQSICLT